MLQLIVSGSHELADESAKDTDSTICARPCTASVRSAVLDRFETLFQFRGRRAVRVIL